MIRVHGFYGHVRRNDLRSLVMFAGFLLAFQVVMAVVLVVPLSLLDIQHAPYFPRGYAGRYVPLVFLAGIVLFGARFARHLRSVQAELGVRIVERRGDPRLVNIVETAAVAAGLPLPQVGLIETPALNAFACGTGQRSAMVIVTRGLLEALSDRELKAVVAHEIAHIRHGDIRLMAAANVFMDILLRSERRSLLRISNWRRAILAVVFPPYLLLSKIGGIASYAALSLARVSRLLIASSREYVADADAVRQTQDPDALISALRRIAGRSAIPGLSPTCDAMMIDGVVEGPYASHPSIADRIAVLARLSGVSHPREANTARSTRDLAPILTATAGAVNRPRDLFARVNVGVTRNFTGASPAARRVMVCAFSGLVALQFWAIWQVGSDRARWEAANAPAIARGKQRGAAFDRLEAGPPVVARCFRTDRYSVGDRGGVLRLATPDPALIESALAGSLRDSSEIQIERYLASRLRSVRNVQGSAQRDRGAALLGYVEQRKILLEVSHRFFGLPGLDLMRAAYDTPADAAILAEIRSRRDAGTLIEPRETATPASRLDIDLLLAAPADFVPCVVRVDEMEAGTTGLAPDGSSAMARPVRGSGSPRASAAGGSHWK